MKHNILFFTGGHHTSALEVAQSLSKDVNIVWFGHKHSAWGDKSNSAEYQEVTASGFKFIDLKAGKFYKTFNPLKLILIPIGFIQAFILLTYYKIIYPKQIKGVVSFGGYLAVPVAISAWLLGIKIITHEQTLVAGLANRLISLFCVKIAISWPQSARYFPVDKTVVVGIPIRKDVLEAPKVATNSQIYVTGGKQGSHVINKAIFSSLGELIKSYTVIHQTGSNTKFNDFQAAQKLASDKYRPAIYFNAKEAAQNIQSSSVVVSRAGAHTIGELLYFQKPCVLIPIPWVSQHEQDKNAEFLESLGLAIVLPETKLTPKNLIYSIVKAKNLHPMPYQFEYHGLQNFSLLVRQMYSIL